MKTCHFCHAVIRTEPVPYHDWLYHEKCMAKLRSLARATRGVM